MKNLILIGGCSKSGKSTLIRKLSAKHKLPYSRKLDLVQEMSDKEGVDLIENFVMLEKLSIYYIKNKFKEFRTFLMEIHYGIQPNIDNEYAFTGKVKNEIDEPYINSTDEENITLMATNFSLSLINIKVNPYEVLLRRKKLAKNQAMRSLSLESIKKEIYWGNHYFNEFCKLSKSNNINTKKYVISNNSIEKSFCELNQIINKIS